MYDCETIAKLIHPHLDRELSVKESLRVQVHLQECVSCRAAFLAEKDFLDLLRPMITTKTVPAFARRRISAALAREAHRHDRRRSRWVTSSGLVALSGTAVVAVALAFFVFFNASSEPVPDLVGWAVAEHRQSLKYPSRLDVTNSDPQAVSRWLYAQDLNVALPPLKLDHITLIGARSSSRKTDRAAYIAYQIDNERVSLFATSPREGRVAGRNAVAFRNILFHPATVDGYYTLQWTDSRHTYVLVAKQRHTVHQACAVCHGETRSREMEEGLTQGI